MAALRHLLRTGWLMHSAAAFRELAVWKSLPTAQNPHLAPDSVQELRG